MTPWRLADRTGSEDSWGDRHFEHQYAAICPTCGRPRGWAKEIGAARHLHELRADGYEQGLHPAEYTPGDDGTCPGH